MQSDFYRGDLFRTCVAYIVYTHTVYKASESRSQYNYDKVVKVHGEHRRIDYFKDRHRHKVSIILVICEQKLIRNG